MTASRARTRKPHSKPGEPSAEVVVTPSADEQVRAIAEMMGEGTWRSGSSHVELARRWGMSINSVYDRASEAGRVLRLAMGNNVDAIVGAAVAHLDTIVRLATTSEKYDAAIRGIELKLRALRALEPREGPPMSGPPAATFPSAKAALAYVENLLPKLREQAARETEPAALPEPSEPRSDE